MGIQNLMTDAEAQVATTSGLLYIDLNFYFVLSEQSLSPNQSMLAFFQCRMKDTELNPDHPKENPEPSTCA